MRLRGVSTGTQSVRSRQARGRDIQRRREAVTPGGISTVRPSSAWVPPRRLSAAGGATLQQAGSADGSFVGTGGLGRRLERRDPCVPGLRRTGQLLPGEVLVRRGIR